MITVGNILNMIVLLVVLVLAGEWSFGLYGAIAGLVLALVVMAVVIRLRRPSDTEGRFDQTGGNPA